MFLSKGPNFKITPDFSSVPQLSIEQLFFSAKVVQSRTPKIPKQKHASQQLFLQNISLWLFSNFLQ